MNRKNSCRTIDIVIPSKNSGDDLVVTIGKWLNQSLPDGWSIFVYLVNDGSTDGSIEKVVSQYCDNEFLNIITNKTSQGRARSRNIGADAGHGEFIAFFDADCSPRTNMVINRYIESLRVGKENLLFGDLKSTNKNIYGRYFNDVSERRKKNFKNGDKTALTTANCIVSRNVFEEAGKYNEEYTRYGFEDKDLIIRMLDCTENVKFVEDAVVEHCDDQDLDVVCKKMYAAGRYSSKIFIERNKEIYKTMKYSNFDVGFQNKPLFVLIRITALFKDFLTGLFLLLEKYSSVYKLNRCLISIISGVSYFEGTVDRES